MATMRAHVLPSLFAVLDIPGHKIGHPSGSVRMSIAASPRISTLETPVNRNGEGSPNIPKAAFKVTQITEHVSEQRTIQYKYVGYTMSVQPPVASLS